MKKLLLTILSAGALALNAHAQSQNILVVDVTYVFNNSTEAKAEQEKFTNGVAKINELLNDRVQKLTELQNDITNTQNLMNAPTATADAKATYKKTIEDKYAEYQKVQADAATFQKSSQATIQDQQKSIVDTEFKKIQGVCSDIAKQRKADLVINTSNFTVLYNDKAMDITEEVLKKLNADISLTLAGSSTSMAGSALPSAPASSGAKSSSSPSPLGSALPGATSKP